MTFKSVPGDEEMTSMNDVINSHVFVIFIINPLTCCVKYICFGQKWKF